MIHYPSILPVLPAYTYLEEKGEHYPVAYSFQPQILSLPIYPEITTEEIDYVVENIVLFYKQYPALNSSNIEQLATAVGK